MAVKSELFNRTVFFVFSCEREIITGGLFLWTKSKLEEQEKQMMTSEVYVT